MRKELIEEFTSRGCKVEDRYHKVISNVHKESRDTIKRILEKNGYTVNEKWSGETTIHYKVTPTLFKQIVEKYDLDSFFQAIECFGEIMHQNECGQMGSGAEFSVSHHDTGFYFCLDFQHHKIKTLHFGDERVIKDYDGNKCYIDEINCSYTDKLILEAIWKLDQETEEIRWLPSEQAPKKVVQYRKILRKWQDFMSALSEDWKGSKLVFGKIYSIERSIEYWEEHIGREAQKHIRCIA